MKSKVETHFDKVAESYDKGKQKYSYYYSNLKRLLRGEIPSGKAVFELGCGTGDLLVSLKPNYGYGMDISSKMVVIAKERHHESSLQFSTKWPKRKFDYIFMSDVIEHLENPKEIFKRISKLVRPKTKFIITMANPLWEPLLIIWEKLGWKMKEGPHKRIGYEEIKRILEENGFKIIEHNYKLLIPVSIPVITSLVNRYLEPLLKPVSFIEYVVAVRI